MWFQSINWRYSVISYYSRNLNIPLPYSWSRVGFWPVVTWSLIIIYSFLVWRKNKILGGFQKRCDLFVHSALMAIARTLTILIHSSWGTSKFQDWPKGKYKIAHIRDLAHSASPSNVPRRRFWMPLLNVLKKYQILISVDATNWAVALRSASVPHSLVGVSRSSDYVWLCLLHYATQPRHNLVRPCVVFHRRIVLNYMKFTPRRGSMCSKAQKCAITAYLALGCLTSIAPVHHVYVSERTDNRWLWMNYRTLRLIQWHKVTYSKSTGVCIQAYLGYCVTPSNYGLGMSAVVYGVTWCGGWGKQPKSVCSHFKTATAPILLYLAPFWDISQSFDNVYTRFCHKGLTIFDEPGILSKFKQYIIQQRVFH
jgi:hypothetical protein